MLEFNLLYYLISIHGIIPNILILLRGVGVQAVILFN